MDLLIRGGTCVDGSGSFSSDLLVRAGKIAEIRPGIDTSGLSSDVRIIDADGLYVLPGLIDAHTHYHLVSRGTETADGFADGSRLAAFGGVTSVVDFADHLKEKSLAASFQERRTAMEQQMAIDFALHQGVYRMHSRIPQELAELREQGITALKIFTTYKQVGYLIEQEGLRELFNACRELKMMVTVHAEDDRMIEELSAGYGEKPAPPEAHPRLRPAEAEASAITRIGELAGSAGMPIYIVHLSSQAGLEAVQRLRRAGVSVQTETTPHYLQLDERRLTGESGPLFLMTPPLRTEDDNRALWDGVCERVISIIATDHCSFTWDQKLSSRDCRTIFPGIPGTEEMLPLIHTFGVRSGRITISDMAALLSENPARAFGLYPQKGSLAPGTDADLLLFDPEESWQITDAAAHTAAGYTPYHGTHVSGRAVMTILRGRLIMEEGKYTGVPGRGRFIPAGLPQLYQDSN